MELLLRGGLNLTSVRSELTERTLNMETFVKVANEYWRLRRSAGAQTATAPDSEFVGALGFWLLTMRMMYYTARPCDHDRSWEHRQRLLNRIFDDPAVRQVFAKLYRFPHRDLFLDTASIHRLGTTSFILRCRSRRDGDEDALKCILYPYLDDEAIAAATAEYHGRYGNVPVDRPRHRVLPMARVYASRAQWIRMDFIHGRTLEEALQDVRHTDDGPHQLPVESLRRYGIPLLEALRDVPYPHLDLSPSNVMVIEHAAEGDRPASVDIVLIDFGQNYLLTRDVGSGSVAAETARHVAPELLRSRGSSEPSGYEDVYSVGNILLDIVRYGDSEGGFIRNNLYMDAPFLGRLVEDLVDEDPSKRLLLVKSDARSLLDAADRSAIYTELRDNLQQGIRAYEELAAVTPTSAASPRHDRLGWHSVTDRVLGPVGALLMALSVVRRPVNFLKLARQGGSVGTEYSYLFAWASLCSMSWAAGWAATLHHLGDNALWKLIVLLPRDLMKLLLSGSPGPLLRHFGAIASVPVTAWDDLLFRIVLITVIVTAAKYYMEIFAGLSVRRFPFSIGHRTIEIVMRMTGVVSARSCSRPMRTPPLTGCRWEASPSSRSSSTI